MDNNQSNTNEDLENTPNEQEDKQEKTIGADIIRGHINTIILRTLYNGDKYGYDIINEIELKSHGQYTLKQPTLYSALKRLEAQGYVKSYWGGVSNGGRRRYFSLTDTGKTIAEQNQSEWEYSRSIIDELISKKEYDFSKPAPSALDLNLLKQCTTRTPVLHNTSVEEDKQNLHINSVNATSPVTEKKEEEKEKFIPKNEAPIFLYNTKSEEERNYKNLVEQIYSTCNKEDKKTKEDNPISKPESTQQELKEKKAEKPNKKQENKTPISTQKTQKQEVLKPITRVDFSDIEQLAEEDGLKILTVGDNKKTITPNADLFHKGLSLFKSSLLILIISFIECAILFIFHKNSILDISLTYCIIPFIVFLCVTIICFLLSIFQWGRNTRKYKKSSILSTGFILFIIASILILAFALLIKVDFSSIQSVLQDIVIPIIFAFNIVLFSIFYHLKSKK